MTPMHLCMKNTASLFTKACMSQLFVRVTVVCSFVSVNPHAVSSSLAMELDVDQFVEEFLVKSRSAAKQVESVLASTYIHRYQYNG